MTPFTATRVSRKHTITLNHNPAAIFPLFTPEDEKKWAAGWDFEPVFPANGEIEENFIFTTASHDHGQAEAIWIVSCYRPEEHFIEYQRIEPGLKVGRIRIRCRAEAGGKTLATIEYTYTALSEAGNRFVAHFSQEHYLAFIGAWEQAINYYLETGQLFEANV